MPAPVNLDDQATIRRFEEAIKLQFNRNVLPNKSSAENGDPPPLQNGHQSNKTSDTNCSFNETLPSIYEVEDSGDTTTKKPQLDAAHPRSPELSGVVPPPPSPDARNITVGQLISDTISNLPTGVTFGMGDSIHAPKTHQQSNNNYGNRQSLSPADHVALSSPHLSPTEQRDMDWNFSRMSFQAADKLSIPVHPVSKSSDRGVEGQPAFREAATQTKTRSDFASDMQVKKEKSTNGLTQAVSDENYNPHGAVEDSRLPPHLRNKRSSLVADELMKVKAADPISNTKLIDSVAISSYSETIKSGIAENACADDPRPSLIGRSVYSVNVQSSLLELTVANASCYQKNALTETTASKSTIQAKASSNVSRSGLPSAAASSESSITTQSSIVFPQASSPGHVNMREDGVHMYRLKAWPNPEERFSPGLFTTAS